MCGIAGFIGNGDRSDLHRMTRAQVHRGPDGEGFYEDIDNAVYLGHRRLAIVDIAGGTQPMWTADGKIGVVYNGEIYNHAELREELDSLGHVFRSSHSDTEVLVHGWRAWGTDLASRLNGMFAFAIYDRERNLVYLARDRFGEKPLFYYAHSNLFAFASELSALATHREISTELAPRALVKFLAYGYLPAPHALWRGCRKLPGGCWLTVDTRRLRPQVSEYWRFSIEPDETLSDRDESRLVETLSDHLSRAVDRRLMSDVPLGVFLSGGLDSSSVLAGAVRHRAPSTVKTFTIGFEEPSFDESAYAEAMARHVGVRHHRRMMSIDEARRLIPTVLPRLDEPLGDASILPTSLLCQFTREHVTVALSGDGGDELFAGYDPFAALGLAKAYQAIVPRWMHSGMKSLADLLPVSERNMAFDFKLKRALKGLSYQPALWNPTWMAPLDPQLLSDALHEPVHPEEIYDEALAAWHSTSGGADYVDRSLEFFTRFYLQDDILMKADRAAMMASLESRAVFLDNDLVDFCRRLPNRFKMRGHTRKYLLRKAFATALPKSILGRPKKGFGIPTAKWLKDAAMEPNEQSIGKIQGDWVHRRWEEHRRGSRDHRLFLWSWLSLLATVGHQTDPAPH